MESECWGKVFLWCGLNLTLHLSFFLNIFFKLAYNWVAKLETNSMSETLKDNFYSCSKKLNSSRSGTLPVANLYRVSSRSVAPRPDNVTPEAPFYCSPFRVSFKRPEIPALLGIAPWNIFVFILWLNRLPGSFLRAGSRTSLLVESGHEWLDFTKFYFKESITWW